VPLPDQVVEALRAIRHDGPFVFNPNAERPLPYSTCYQRLRRIAERAGVPKVSWHPLRHTTVTELTAKGVSIRVVQELLGHTTPKMTARYAHVSSETLRAPLAKLSYGKRVATEVGHQSGQFGSAAAPIGSQAPQHASAIRSAT
jgi:integrase